MRKQISILISLVFIFSALFNSNVALAAESVMSGFNPDKIIDDKVFSDKRAMGSADAVQKFLESKNSILANTSSAFVSLLREPSSSSLKEMLEDEQPSLNRNRTAAELIWDAAQSSGVNPQVILITLNKEQSLITGRQNATSEQIQRALDFAMGFGCPDSQPCGELYRGFYFQLFGNVDSENNRYLGAAKSLYKSYNTPGGRGPLFNGAVSKVGDVITLPNTVGNYEGVMPQQSVTLSNAATAALYRYTPHVFNGNYNFWKFFKLWFGGGSSDSSTGNSSGLVIRSNTMYMIENGQRFKILSFVEDARSLSAKKAKKVTTKELEKYPLAGYLSPSDNTIISVNDTYYVFIGGVKRPVSTFVLEQRGLQIKKAVDAPESEAKVFTTGTVLPPNDGAVLRAQSGGDTYLVEGGVLKKFTVETLAQYNVASQVKTVADEELNSYPKNGMVTPKPATPAPGAVKLVKGSSPAVYAIENNQKTLLSYELFMSKGYKFTDVVAITDTELNGYATADGAAPATPAPSTSVTPPTNMTFFSNKKTGEFWVYLNGGKHLISTFVAKQKMMTPDVAYEDAYVNALPTSTPIIPREGTIVKGTTADVYLITGGVARPMTYTAFVARKITPAQIVVLPQAEIDGYVKGALLTQ